MDCGIITASIGVAGTLAGIGLGYLLNRNAAQKAINIAFPKTVDFIVQHELIKAGIQFREAFFDTIDRLKSREIEQPIGGPTESNLAQYVIEKSLPQHRMAWRKFRCFLSNDNRAAFDAAWNEYICKEEHGDYEAMEDFSFYGYKLEPPMKIQDEIANRDLALKRIEKLFEFTKAKN